ncbi:MAG: uncharacterized protein PWP15_1309 [Methanothermococcus sp.]|jgi:hypothetical protein|uniref:CoA-binding protein n=1 Tax=Methanothermococcus TaxID=155862 RepID=UPI0003612227|nr:MULTISPECIES: CoA-binding protein [Methanothermococcus]MDK2790800.1 uncharacterized protein [Methanothermococcus sp.]MDK2988021.1 uncharacterized protein [Methanothermococcus sp.]
MVVEYMLKDDEIKRILQESRTVVVVGISPNPEKPSYFVSESVKKCGFKIYFVNPKYSGQEILGEKVYPAIKDIPDEIDIVVVFRKPSEVPHIAEEAKEKGFKTFWLQPGTENKEVVEQLLKEGYKVVVGRCIRVECRKIYNG